MTNPQNVLCRYHYDPLDRLAGHMATGEDDIRLFYQKSRLVTQIQGALQRSILHGDEQVLAQRQLSGKTMTTTLLAADLQRSVLHSMDGESREGLAYTTYGHLSMDSGLSSLLGFNGERRDPLTGHYLLGAGYRAFNPVLMRFNSPDTLSPFGEGGLNAYAYCLGDPINLADATGRVPYAVLLKLGRSRHSLAYVSGRTVSPNRGLNRLLDAPIKRIGRPGAFAAGTGNGPLSLDVPTSLSGTNAVASTSSAAGRSIGRAPSETSSISPRAFQYPSAPPGTLTQAPPRAVRNAHQLEMFDDAYLSSLNDSQYKQHIKDNIAVLRTNVWAAKNREISARAYGLFQQEYAAYMLRQYQTRYRRFISSGRAYAAIKKYKDFLK